ncbi:lysophospholipase L1-like esterase [Sphingomonas sp. SORGH_AS870]|uniref:SGNH/GDSL hydrolase family protein n=1 Tax=Sphingomonas sp. SORGH_AS_0870 TaxID=3041801 RepID=UPI0028649ACC|nr:SGNH/GDSL hydrolase family protein [Sphingomonas sp. SORGH_AS_0870]MDR6146124.1 lysophospholipase L1-like esterase [Sphingomonas sp. SORGH_AS_0870]
MARFLTTTAPIARNRRVVTALGDSRIAAIFNDPSKRTKGARSPLNWANALSDQRFTIVETFGISGDRTDQMLSRIDPAIATGAGLLYLQGGVNNIGAVASTGNYTYTHGVTGEVVTIDTVAAVTFRDLRTMIEKARMAGMAVVVEQEVGSGGFNTQEKVAATLELRSLMAEYAETATDVYLHDALPVVMQPALSPTALGYRAGYSYDTTHCNSRGGYRWGKSLGVLLRSIVPISYPLLLNNAIEVFGARRRQVLTNPLFLTANGGTANEGISGTTPAGWTISRTGSATANISTSGRSDGSGNDLVIAASYTATGEIVTVSQALEAPGLGMWNSRVAVGDTYELVAQIEVTEATNLAAIWLQSGAVAGTGSQVDCFDLFGVANEVGMDEPGVLTLRTRPFTVAAPITNSYPYIACSIRAVGAGSGSCTFRIRQIALKRRMS